MRLNVRLCPGWCNQRVESPTCHLPPVTPVIHPGGEDSGGHLAARPGERAVSVAWVRFDPAGDLLRRISPPGGVPAGLLPNGRRRVVIAGADDGRFGLGVGVYPAPYELDGVGANMCVGIVEHDCDGSWEHGGRVRPASVVLASITSKGVASLEPNARIGVVEHPYENRQTAGIDEVIHGLRRPAPDVGVRRVEARLHAVERVGTTQDEVPERSLRPDRIREQSDPSAVVVVVGERGHVGSLALAPLLTGRVRQVLPVDRPSNFPSMFPALFALDPGRRRWGTDCGPGRPSAVLRGARSLPSRRVTRHPQRGRRGDRQGQRAVGAPSADQRVQLGVGQAAASATAAGPTRSLALDPVDRHRGAVVRRGTKSRLLLLQPLVEVLPYRAMASVGDVSLGRGLQHRLRRLLGLALGAKPCFDTCRRLPVAGSGPRSTR